MNESFPKSSKVWLQVFSMSSLNSSHTWVFASVIVISCFCRPPAGQARNTYTSFFSLTALFTSPMASPDRSSSDEAGHSSQSHLYRFLHHCPCECWNFLIDLWHSQMAPIPGYCTETPRSLCNLHCPPTTWGHMKATLSLTRGAHWRSAVGGTPWCSPCLDPHSPPSLYGLNTQWMNVCNL